MANQEPPPSGIQHPGPSVAESQADEEVAVEKPEVSRFMLAMFDVLGFSQWLEKVGLSSVLDAYHALIQDVVVRPHKRGGLTAVRTGEGAIFALTGPPGYAYFSDTILLWYRLEPVFVDIFIGSCNDMICGALSMGIPLRGAITTGEAVLDADEDLFLGVPIVEAARLEKAQNWIGGTLGNSALWPQFVAQIHGTAIIEYPPPVKEHLTQYSSPIVLDWPRRWRDKHKECPSVKLRELNTDPAFALYWENTISFANYSLSKHDWHLRPDEVPDGAILRMTPAVQARDALIE